MRTGLGTLVSGQAGTWQPACIKQATAVFLVSYALLEPSCSPQEMKSISLPLEAGWDSVAALLKRTQWWDTA